MLAPRQPWLPKANGDGCAEARRLHRQLSPRRSPEQLLDCWRAASFPGAAPIRDQKRGLREGCVLQLAQRKLGTAHLIRPGCDHLEDTRHHRHPGTLDAGT